MDEEDLASAETSLEVDVVDLVAEAGVGGAYGHASEGEGTFGAAGS